MEIVKVPAEKIRFHKPYLNTPAGQAAQKGGDYYLRIKTDIIAKGIINPIILTRDTTTEEESYTIAIGHKRFLIGRDLGYTHFNAIILDNPTKAQLQAIVREYLPTGADNAYYTSVTKRHDNPSQAVTE